MQPTLDVTAFFDVYRNRKPAKSEPAWLRDRREDAMMRFVAGGLPRRKQEGWQFSDLERLKTLPAAPATDEGRIDFDRLSACTLGVPTHRVVMVNGVFAPDLSAIGEVPAGAYLGSTAEALEARPALIEAALDRSEIAGGQPFAALNAAMFGDGFVLTLDPDVVLDKPVEIVHFGDGQQPRAFHIRNVIWAGSRAKATIVETFIGSGSGWTNMVTAVEIGEEAAIRHVRVQNDPADATHLALSRATLGKAAAYETFILTLGARLSRQEISVLAAGEDARTTIIAASLLRGDQEGTLAPLVDHAVPRCETKEVVKALIEDRAHGVFLGKMRVAPGADGTDAHQLNQNLLLSRTASVDTKPELEIFADEVKCSHGATVGELDEAALFYLRARGIRETDARHMLMEAFAAEAIEAAELGEVLGTYLAGQIRAWFDGKEDGR